MSHDESIPALNFVFFTYDTKISFFCKRFLRALVIYGRTWNCMITTEPTGCVSSVERNSIQLMFVLKDRNRAHVSSFKMEINNVATSQQIACHPCYRWFWRSRDTSPWCNGGEPSVRHSDILHPSHGIRRTRITR
jgi:hypothetical protein